MARTNNQPVAFLNIWYHQMQTYLLTDSISTGRTEMWSRITTQQMMKLTVPAHSYRSIDLRFYDPPDTNRSFWRRSSQPISWLITKPAPSGGEVGYKKTTQLDSMREAQIALNWLIWPDSQVYSQARNPSSRSTKGVQAVNREKTHNTKW